MTAWLETKQAHRVKWNRRNNESDEDETQEWEQMGAEELDLEGEGWTKKVESSRPDVQTDVAVLEVRALREQVEELKRLIVEGKGSGGGGGGRANGGA